MLVGTPRGGWFGADHRRRGWRGIGHGTGCGPRTMRRWWWTCGSASRFSPGRGLPDGSASRSAGSRSSRNTGRPGWPTASQGRGPGETTGRLELKGSDLPELPVPDDHETGAVSGGEVHAVGRPVHRVDRGGVAGAPDDHGVAGCRLPQPEGAVGARAGEASAVRRPGDGVNWRRVSGECGDRRPGPGSHRRTVRLWPPVAMRVPSGDQAAAISSGSGRRGWRRSGLRYGRAIG